MKRFPVAMMIPFGLACLGIASLYFWLTADPAAGLIERLPGSTEAPQQPSPDKPAGPAYGELATFDGVPSDIPGDWPRFRGSNFDAVSLETDVTLARTLPEEGPRVIWSIEVGEGYAGPVIFAGSVYLLDYDHEKQADTIRCMSLEKAEEIWRYSYPVVVKRYHGMSRTVPAVTEKFIVTLGPKCHVACLDSMTGEFRWGLDLVKDFGAEVPPWYAGQCPLIDNGRAILAVGGDALMMAVDCETGDILWQSPNPHGWVMTHSSIIPVEFAGRRMYVYCAGGGVVGVSAEDGAVLWEFDKWKIRIANVACPVIVDEGLIFLSGGYNAGSMMLRLVEQNGTISPQPDFRLAPEVFGSPQHTPVFYEGDIYGVRPDGQLACLDTEGNVLWSSGATRTFGLGPYMIANGLIYAMNDDGELTLAEATRSGYVELAHAKVLHGRESWGPMAVASGWLIVRDLKTMLCLDITEP